MKTAYLSEIGQVLVKDLDIPEIQDNEILIKVNCAGICGSDVHAYHGHHPFRKPPMVLGHEVVGEVSKLGGEVTGISIGDRVTVEPLKGCGTCLYCLRGEYNLCKTRVSAGTNGWLGAMAEFFVAPADKVYVLPASMEYQVGLLAEPLAVGVHAVELSEIGESENILIVGTGPIGLLTGVAAQAKGAKNIYCTDINDFRLGFAQSLGLQTINVNKQSIKEVTEETVPDGFDVVFLAVTSKEAVEQALTYVQYGGKIVVITIFTSEIPFNMGFLQEREIEVKGSMVYTKPDFELALKILSDRGEDMKRFITHQVPIEDVNEAMQVITSPKNEVIKMAVYP
ncbi:zinc-dependent alcohol dehydrogenase [Halalkalibacter oceani]|uniref:zinc-dependent alcohol dehydrogenase n=1 Tax=Halalkalibacter oceani TaxID=1653776 RepID=UPI003397B8C0